MTCRHFLLALTALTVPAAAFSQMPMPAPVPRTAPRPVVAEPWMAQPPPPPGVVPPAVAEPWMAQPPVPGQPQVMPQAPRPSNRGPALEPIDIPPAIEQGVDMIYIDEDLVPKAVHDNANVPGVSFAEWSGSPVDLFEAVNPIYTQLRRGLVRYQQSWGALPNVPVPVGLSLKAGMTGERVAMLRERLGLSQGASFDAALAAKVKEFQQVHGLKADGVAGAGTIDALNRGPEYYEQLILINMERAKRLPAPDEQRKYLLVDAGSARLSMWQNGRMVDSMKVIVGKAETPTPMMAAYVRYASVNPYWNVPPELAKNLIGPRILAQGISYLTDREYQVLTDWGPKPGIIDPHDVDWQAVVDGRADVRLRRLPSPANSMGMMKFMLPNYFGIYLHDSPEKDHFAKGEQWISNGCVRLEDYKRVAKFLFDGVIPKGDNPKVEKEVDVPRPTPVYMTYLTVQPTANGVQFLEDHYGRDAHLMDRYGTQLLAAVRGQ